MNKNQQNDNSITKSPVVEEIDTDHTIERSSSGGYTVKTPNGSRVKTETSKRWLKIILIIAVLLVVIGGAILYLLGANNKATPTLYTNNTQGSVQKNENSLEETIRYLSTELEEVNAGSTVIEENNGVSGFRKNIEDNTSISIPSVVYANFKQETTPLALTNVRELLKRNDFELTDQSGDDNIGYSFTYTDDSMECDLFGNSFYTRMRCASKKDIELYSNKVPSITTVVSQSLNLKIEQQYSKDIEFLKTSTIYGAVFRASTENDTGDYIATVYLSSINGTNWKYIAQSAIGEQDEINPPCKLFNQAELAVFKNKLGVDCK